MREIRTSGSEGGGTGTTGPPYPYLPVALRAGDLLAVQSLHTDQANSDRRSSSGDVSTSSRKGLNPLHADQGSSNQFGEFKAKDMLNTSQSLHTDQGSSDYSTGCGI